VAVAYSEPWGLSRDSDVQQRRQRYQWFRVYATFGVVTMVFGVIAYRTAPHPFSLALLLLIMAVTAVLTRPVLGVYFAMFFTLIGDAATSAWYPFAKNLSSAESILFIDDSISISPLEVILVVTTIGWLLHYQDRVGRRFYRGALLYPLLAFTFFVLLGFVQGINSGGDRNVALWEMRPLLYVPLFYVLITQLLTTRVQYVRLFMVAMVAVFVHALVAINYFRKLPAIEKYELESLGEHGASIHIDAMLLLLLALLLIKGCSRTLRVLVFLLAIPCTIAYVMAERRAAIVALAAGVVMLSLVLHKRNRRAFWWFVPSVIVVTLVYLAAFWSAQSEIGFAAQAIKSVIAPDQLSEADRSSDLYRQIENYDLSFTIKQAPVTGLGFGHPFSQPIPLPDISFYEFYRYIPHNSVLWIWIQTGFFGFVSMFFLFGRAMALAGRKLRSLTNLDDVIVVAV
jgi:hypothetical protein